MDRPEDNRAQAASDSDHAAENLRQCAFDSGAVNQLQSRQGTDASAVVNGGGMMDLSGLPALLIDKQVRPNVENEIREVTNLLDFNKPAGPNQTHADKVASGAERLSRDLKQLSDTISDYNKLLKGVADNIPDEPVSNPLVHLGDFNKKTGTWNTVTIDTYHMSSEIPMQPAYRIVQPGNTLSGIAQEGKQFIKSQPTTAEYVKYLQKLNNIENPDKIVVGQAIKLRENFFE
jgi:LysM repeat protein